MDNINNNMNDITPNTSNSTSNDNDNKNGLARVLTSKLLCCFQASTNLTPLRRQKQYIAKNSEVTNTNLDNNNNENFDSYIKIDNIHNNATQKKSTKSNALNKQDIEPAKYSW